MLVYTSLVRQAVHDMARVVPAMRHIDARRVAVVAAPRASSGPYGNLAQCFALRQRETEDFAYWFQRRTRQVVRVTPWVRRRNTAVNLNGAEMLYAIVLRLPRLLSHDPIATIVHELVHIGLDFDGQLNRLRHGRKFDALAGECARLWRAHGDRRLVEALGRDYRSTVRDCGSLAAHSFLSPFVSPRLCPVERPAPFESHPDFRRKRLTFDPAAVEVVAVEWTPPDVPERLTEKDLVYRVYAPDGARRISASVVAAAETHGALPPAANLAHGFRA